MENAASSEHHVRRGVIPFGALIQTWAALLLVSGLVVALMAAPHAGVVEDRESGTPVMQAISLGVYLPSLFFIAGRPGSALRVVARGWAYSMLLALAVASFAWSVQPDISLRRSMALLVAMLFVIHAASWFTPEQFIRQMALIFGLLLFLSLAAAMVPGYGIHPSGVHAGRWRGVLSSKNTFGLLCGAAGFCYAVLYIKAKGVPRERLVFGSMFCLALLLCFLSNARTPLLALIAALIAIFFARLLFLPSAGQARMTMSLRVTLIGAAMSSVLVLIPMATALVLSLLGRSVTLTGRGKLWEYAFNKGLDRPLLGAGYKTFWVDRITYDLRVFHQYWTVDGEPLQMTSNAHNGYLDAWLELGVPGLLLVLLMFSIAAYRANQCLARSKDPIFLWHVGAVTFVSVYYVTNSYILKHNELAWFIAAYAFYSLSAFKPRCSPAGGTPRPEGNATRLIPLPISRAAQLAALVDD
jgi:O-antigen ligase